MDGNTRVFAVRVVDVRSAGAHACNLRVRDEHFAVRSSNGQWAQIAWDALCRVVLAGVEAAVLVKGHSSTNGKQHCSSTGPSPWNAPPADLICAGSFSCGDWKYAHCGEGHCFNLCGVVCVHLRLDACSAFAPRSVARWCYLLPTRLREIEGSYAICGQKKNAHPQTTGSSLMEFQWTWPCPVVACKTLRSWTARYQSIFPCVSVKNNCLSRWQRRNVGSSGVGPFSASREYAFADDVSTVPKQNEVRT